MEDVLERGDHRVLLGDAEAGELAAAFERRPAEEVLAWALQTFGDRVALASSLQAESLVLLDMAWRLDPGIRVFTVDTGRLPPETYDLIDRVRERYGVRFEVVFPDAGDVEGMTTRHGVNLFYEAVEKRLLCCRVRKVAPLRRKLALLDAWVTGLRREQLASRGDVRKVALDPDHDGIVKLSPLADWTHEQVWDYMRTNDVPHHPLYDAGYTSISCACCTRATKPGEDARAGRWWWEQDALKECGIHCSIETGGLERRWQAGAAGAGA